MAGHNKQTSFNPYSQEMLLGLSATTGSASPGKVIQFGTTAGLTIGKGIEVSGTLNSDGSLTIGGEAKTGISGGAGIVVCVKDTTNLCVSKGK